MSLYNMMHGYEPTARIVLTMLNIDPRVVGRFRDAYVTYKDASKSEPVLVILTRTGGNNRPDHEEQNKALQNHPLYLDDSDDDFDSTFALFRFTVPEEYRQPLLELLTHHGAPKSLWEKTEMAIAAMKQP